jgi:hypothetical protein
MRHRSWDSSVGIEIVYKQGGEGVRVRFLVGERDFSLLHSFQTGSGAYPASYPVDTRALFLGVKQKGHEADHSLPSSADVRNDGAIYLLPHMPSWYSVQLHN